MSEYREGSNDILRKLNELQRRINADMQEQERYVHQQRYDSHTFQPQRDQRDDVIRQLREQVSNLTNANLRLKEALNSALKEKSEMRETISVLKLKKERKIRINEAIYSKVNGAGNGIKGVYERFIAWLNK